MTSKSLFFKLMKEDGKRRLWAIGLSFLVFFFWFPVAAAMGCSEIAGDYDHWIQMGRIFEGTTAEIVRDEKLSELAVSVLSVENIMVAVTVMFGAIILGMTGFLYLHSRKQVDFYHSVPVKREWLFGITYLNGVLMVLAAYLINMVLALGVFAMNGVKLSEVMGMALLAAAVHMVGFLLMYGLMIISVLLTGNFFISILGGIVLFSYIPAVLGLMEILKQMFFQTMQPGKNTLYSMMIHGSPFSYYITLIADAAALDEGILVSCGLSFLVSMVLFAAAVILYRLRPSEAAGKAMAFRITRTPIKFLLVIPCTIGVSLLFWNIYHSLPWSVFGFVMGLFVSHCLIEVIYHFEFRKLFSNAFHMGICAVAAVAVIGVFRYDLTGFDRYIPGESSFESAALTVSGFDDWPDEYGVPYKTKDGYDWRYIWQNDYVEENMKITDYEVVKTIAEAGAAQAKEEKEGRLTDRYYINQESEEDFWVYMDVMYRLKNGKAAYREYHVNVTQLRDAFESIYQTAEYKKGCYPVMNLTADSVKAIYEMKAAKIEKVEADANLQAEILAAYQEELSALTLKERSVETPVTSLRFMTPAEYEYLTYRCHENHPNYTGDFHLSDMNHVNLFPVYPSFTKTIALLEKAGRDPLGQISLEEVDEIEILNNYSYRDRASYEYEEYAEENGSAFAGEAAALAENTEATYADKDWQDQSQTGGIQRTLVIVNDGTPENTKIIEEILSMAAPSDLVNMNHLQDINPHLDVKIYSKSENEGKAQSDQVYVEYLFTGEEIPESLKGAIHYEEVSNHSIWYGINGKSR